MVLSSIQFNKTADGKTHICSIHLFRRQDVSPSTTNQSNLGLQLTSTCDIDFDQYKKVFESVLVQPSDYTFTGELGEG